MPALEYVSYSYSSEEYIYALQMHNTALEVTDTTTPEYGRLFIKTNFKLF
jgi:hypothetical protein